MVESFNPSQALKRYEARAKLEAVKLFSEKRVAAEKRKYEGATKGRHFSDWFSPEKSVNQEVMQDLAVLRDRSRDLARNNSYMINAVRTLRHSVVGTGILPTPIMSKGITKNHVKVLKEAWQLWAEKTACDYDNMNTFNGLQSLIIKTVAESGECLIRKVRGSSSEVLPLRLQLIEGDYLDCNHDSLTWDADGTRTSYGIKFNREGKRVGYWLYKGHPSEYGTESEFVKAENIIHIYEIERPGQQRGVPFSCGVMVRIKDLDQYELSERVRAKVAASFSVFITNPDPTDGDPRTDDSEYDQMPISPGMITTLQPGQQIQTAQPPTVQGYNEFVRNNVRAVSAGLGVSYESISNDYTNVNFSSGRMGWIAMNMYVEHLQWTLMVPRLCDVIYDWFIEACQLKGVIPFTVKVVAKWTPPRRAMIDPYKEIQGLKEGIRAGLYSWQDVVRTMGYSPEDLKAELLQDKDMFDDMGLKPTVDPRYDPNRPPDASDQPDNKLMEDKSSG